MYTDLFTSIIQSLKIRDTTYGTSVLGQPITMYDLI